MDTSFQDAVAYLMSTRWGRVALFCPACALDRMRGDLVSSVAEQIVYVETVPKAGAGASCAKCGVGPLVLRACELLRPWLLVHFADLVLQMADREAKLRARGDHGRGG